MSNALFTASDFAQGNGRRRTVISLTPLIDVVFILLVFFMLASSFLDWRAIEMETVLPQSKARSQDNAQSLLISVSADETRLNGEPMSAEDLVRRLKGRLSADPDTIVSVKPVGDTALQAVIRVLDRLQEEGITGVSMSRDKNWSPGTAPQP